MPKRSKYQERIIKNFYSNRETIGLQRLAEIVSELYLAEGKARQRQWQYAVAALKKLEVPQQRIDHLTQQDDPALLAKLVDELQGKNS